METGCCWVVGQDANDTPQGLEEWAKVAIGKAGGQIVCQPRATNLPTDAEARNIDYFILPQALGNSFDSV